MVSGMPNLTPSAVWVPPGPAATFRPPADAGDRERRWLQSRAS